MPFNPDQLRNQRRHQGFSREKLAEKARINSQTIKRLENGTNKNPRKHTLERLEKALNLPVGELMRGSRSDTGTDVGRDRRGLSVRRTRIDEATSVNMEMISEIYQMTIDQQIRLAPLCISLLAEASLKWRDEEFEMFLDSWNLMRSNPTLGKDFGIDPGDWHPKDEEDAIENRYVNGASLEYSRYVGVHFDNPFIAYLKRFLKGLERECSHIVISEEVDWDEYPKISIGAERLEEITGGNKWAKYALERGFVQLDEIDESLFDIKKRKILISFLAEKVPEKERERHARIMDGIRKKFDELKNERQNENEESNIVKINLPSTPNDGDAS
jgi:transcriptional regulator with XRE-family HTH domain